MKLLAAIVCLAVGINAENHDVVIYGVTAGGAVAAIAAAKGGAKVALVKPGRHVGGMISGLLGRGKRRQSI